MNSELNHFSSKSDEHMKQMPSPPFWGNFGVKEEWSPFLDSGTQNPMFGRLKMGTFCIFGCSKMGLVEVVLFRSARTS